MKIAGLFIDSNWLSKQAEDLNPLESQVMLLLMSYLNTKTGKAYPAVETLAQILGKSRTTISRSISGLVSKDYLTRETCIGVRTSYLHNVYIVNHYSTAEKKLLAPVMKKEIKKPKKVVKNKSVKGGRHEQIEKYLELS